MRLILHNKKKVSLIAYLFFIVILLVPVSTKAQSYSLPAKTENSYRNILKLRLAEGMNDVEASEEPIDLFIYQYGVTIKTLIEDQPISLNEYEKLNDNTQSQIKKSDLPKPQKNFYLAELLLQSAFVHLKHSEEFSAAWELRKAYRTIVKNIEEFPDYIPHYKTIGLLHVMIGLIPEKFNWIVSMMGMEGTVTQGMSELEKIANADDTFSLEAQVLIPFIKSYVLQQTDIAVKELKPLYTSNQDNLILHYLYALLLIKNAQSEIALAVISNAYELQQNNTYNSITALTYIHAEILLQKGEYSQSLMRYNQYLKLNQGTNFVKDSYYKIALINWLTDDIEEANNYLQLASDSGNTNTEADKYASSQLKEEFPDTEIIKLRFATDGGYYNLANSIVDKRSEYKWKSKKDEVEFTYRIARFYHKTDKIQPTTAYYKLTIESSKNNNWYFAPNAALQLGYLYQKSGEYELAKKYFQLALGYKNHQYKTSIDNKAKAALATLDI